MCSEKNELFGGCFQTYRLKGHLLDTEFTLYRWSGRRTSHESVFSVCRIMDHLKVRKLDENAFDKIFIRIAYYAMGYERLRYLCQSFPHERKISGNIQRY